MSNCPLPHQDDKMNTFQAVLVADDNETYAVFNYDIITWGADARYQGKTVWARVSKTHNTSVCQCASQN